MAFVHLRTHTDHSVANGPSQIDTDAMPALAVNDLSKLFGAIKF